MKGPYRVFISSTYLDNVARRRTVLEAIERAGDMVAVGMERFTADDRPTVEVCREGAQECDVFVGIIAHRYGWEPEGQAPGEEKSITWLEYEAARMAGRPCLMFEIDPNAPFTRADLDPAPGTWEKQQKLERFKARYGKDQLPAVFSEGNLGMAVQQALVEWKARQERPSATYHQALAEFPRKMHWWTRPIPLRASADADAPASDARTTIERWMTDRQARHCVLLGPPGAGKTGLLWWAASALAVKADAFPLLVQARDLKHLGQITLVDLERIAGASLRTVPPSDPGDWTIFLLLDGLDELVGAHAGGENLALELLAKTIVALPPTGRLLAACRTPTFASIGPQLRRELLRQGPAASEHDAYETAIRRALDGAHEDVLILAVEPVSASDASSFLQGGNLTGSLVEKALASRAIRPFLSTPFTIRMLQVALPGLLEEPTLAITDLYRTYIRAALLRQDRSLHEEDLEAVVVDLRKLACDRQHALAPMHETLARDAELLSQARGRADFFHYTLWEYFLALEVLAQISRLESTLLSSLDLVGAYNVNRMLVPMILRALEQGRRSSSTEVRAVPSDEYRRYLLSTRWRAESGYGVHPSMTMSFDGTPSASFLVTSDQVASIHEDRRHGIDVASGLSWYDAAAFSMHAGLRLPTSAEARQLTSRGPYLFWCSDWDNEEISHVRVFNAQGNSVEGLNPDVRLPNAALAVVG